MKNNSLDNMKVDNSFLCKDCLVDTRLIQEYYNLKDEIWMGDVMHEYDCNNYMLCIGCVENRIGRKLNYYDFSLAPVNFDSTKSYRLTERINAMTL